VEFSFDEIHHLVESFGFQIAREEERKVFYAANKHSMMKTEYTCAFFSAVKPDGSTAGAAPVALYEAPGSVRVLPEGAQLRNSGSTDANQTPDQAGGGDDMQCGECS
jgi:hypothetical protein